MRERVRKRERGRGRERERERVMVCFPLLLCIALKITSKTFCVHVYKFIVKVGAGNHISSVTTCSYTLKTMRIPWAIKLHK